MRDVVKRGTATRALSLKRGDLSGKTGTTNDFVDAWFCGYQPSVVGIAWVGFDQPRKLGDKETGGFAALPIWIGYMEKALKGVAETYMDAPPGLVAITTQDEGRSELIYQEHVPPPPPVAPENTEIHAPVAPVTPAAPAVPPVSAPPPAPPRERDLPPHFEQRGAPTPASAPA